MRGGRVVRRGIRGFAENGGHSHLSESDHSVVEEDSALPHPHRTLNSLSDCSGKLPVPSSPVFFVRKLPGRRYVRARIDSFFKCLVHGHDAGSRCVPVESKCFRVFVGAGKRRGK